MTPQENLTNQSGNFSDGAGDGREVLRVEDVLPDASGELAGVNWRLVQSGPNVLLQVDTSPDDGFVAPDHIVTVATLFNLDLAWLLLDEGNTN